jgi:hypothetical protein
VGTKITEGDRHQVYQPGREATMEATWLDKFTGDLQHTLTILFIVLVLYAMYKWSVQGGYYLAGILRSAKMSKQTMRTRKRKEAQVISDGTTILLKELKEQGLLTPAGQAYWERKLKTIGLEKPEEDNLLGKAWHYPVTHSMRELSKYLSRKPTKKKEAKDKTTVICLD